MLPFKCDVFGFQEQYQASGTSSNSMKALRPSLYHQWLLSPVKTSEHLNTVTLELYGELLIVTES